MTATTARPASFSPRKLRSRNAIPSGIAVRASPKLCTRSASSATDPDATKMTSCAKAATPSTPRLSATALTPSRERMMERSIRPWEWP